ncbi:Imm1 family immunity protein [Streptomyces sp. NPDC001393]
MFGSKAPPKRGKFGVGHQLILNVRIGSTYHYAETWQEMSDLIEQVIREQQCVIPGVGIGDGVVFMFASERHAAQTRGWRPDNHLHVGVNSSTGYGGLVWYVSPKRADESGDEISQWCWVSDNPTPPEFDPQVLSDPGSPLCYDPRSTLPVTQVRAALEEFCRTGTGDRPECINWVRGEINGERLKLG